MLWIFKDVTTHSRISYSFNAWFYVLIKVIILPSTVKSFNNISNCNTIARNNGALLNLII